MLAATPIYAGLLALLFVGLSFRVIGGRVKNKVSVGDGDDKDMIKRMRVQANFAEYAPLGIILLAMAEFQGMPIWLVHVFGLMLLVGRCMHAYGLGSTPQVLVSRRWGMMLTFGMIAITALANIGHAIL
ncbi:MAG: MAPEG family protein [Marinosulfonomonas sp.]|nr:MAPEG family protein [Marinosulfonomonas sp.]